MRAKNNRLPQSGAALRTVLLLLVILLVLFSFVAYTFGYVVPPGYIGVRQILVGPDQGFKPLGLMPGYHVAIPFRSKIHVFPRGIQLIDVVQGSSRPDTVATKGLDITTADGAYVEIGASVVARLFDRPKDAEHGGPADLIRKFGTGPDMWRVNTVAVASDQLNRSLSALHAQQFYDPKFRESALEAAEIATRDILKGYGIKVESLLLDHYTFVDKRIDDAIFRKNIQSQEEKLNDQSSKLSAVKAELEQVSAQWDAKIELLRVDGANKAMVTRSEAELYEKEKQSTGDLDYAKAVAEVEKLKAEALSQAAGADIYVARSMAPLLSSIKGGIVEGQDPYDLDGWMKKLGVGK